MKRFGININFDEARVLVASADPDRSNDLNLNEFLDLIFTDNEALNVDLKFLKNQNILHFIFLGFFTQDNLIKKIKEINL